MNTPENFAKMYNLPLETVTYMARNKSLYCTCGSPRCIVDSSQSKVGVRLGNTCGKIECSKLFGKLRPSHSAYMKELAASGKNEKFSNTLMKSGHMHNPKLNSQEFKRVVLDNKGIMGDNIDDAYSAMLRERNLDRRLRQKQLLTRYNNWEEVYKALIVAVCGQVPDPQWCSSLTDEQFAYYWKRVHGINTIRNSDRSGKVGRTLKFRGEIVTGLMFNRKGFTQISTRSSWEANMIRVFERNKVRWSYEEYHIETVDKNGYYVPDFVAEVEGKTYMIEIKGGFCAGDREYYMRNKIGAAIRFCRKKGWNFCMMYKNPTDLKFLDSTTLTGE